MVNSYVVCYLELIPFLMDACKLHWVVIVLQLMFTGLGLHQMSLSLHCSSSSAVYGPEFTNEVWYTVFNLSKVLNLVCFPCDKPCRSKTESDLHTNRTGHTELVDKTLEVAKPINLEVPKVAMDSEEAVDVGSTSQSEEMVVPEVGKKLLEDLEATGFPTAQAIHTIHFSGNTSLEVAVNWVVKHDAGPNIDEMPKVSVNKNAEAPKPSLTPEEMKVKAQELRQRARKKKEMKVNKKNERKHRTSDSNRTE
ncbi:ankyrin repeat-containing protein [Hibiscus syriacus]|uniref:Ankyrin repeat-containing protein n=1 Tax=Hibiscus syriacus TaxID=106335 RepID=A0A6A3AE71_HIBSY|nr:ankyrin repeat-containing protein [Hibiscus syriacus]